MRRFYQVICMYEKNFKLKMEKYCNEPDYSCLLQKILDYQSQSLYICITNGDFFLFERPSPLQIIPVCADKSALFQGNILCLIVSKCKDQSHFFCIKSPQIEQNLSLMCYFYQIFCHIPIKRNNISKIYHLRTCVLRQDAFKSFFYKKSYQLKDIYFVKTFWLARAAKYSLYT